MAYNIFSERERVKQEVDPYQYDEIPEGRRNQIFQVINALVKYGKVGILSSINGNLSGASAVKKRVYPPKLGAFHLN